MIVAVVAIVAMVTTVLCYNYLVNYSSKNTIYNAYFDHTWENPLAEGNLTLRLWVTLHDDGNVIVTAKVNKTTSWSQWDYLGLAFINTSVEFREIDFMKTYKAYVLLADNRSWTPGAVMFRGDLLQVVAYVDAYPGLHEVTFDPNEGYTFTVASWNEQERPTEYIKAENMLYVAFGNIKAENRTETDVFTRFILP